MDAPPTPSPADAALLDRARAWLAQDPDAHTRAQLARWLLAHDMAPLRAAFAGRLRFGTAGLRAPMGPGPMHLNALVVQQSVAGIAEVLRAQVPGAQARGVAVGFDGRHNSRAFALAACGVLLAQGFAVHLVDEPCPTPVVGFWVKMQRLAGGLMITASHNPPQYNGIKVYWQDAAQIVSPQDRDIAAAIDRVAAAPTAPPCLQGAALTAAPGLSWVGAAAQTDYLTALRTHAPTPSGATSAPSGATPAPAPGEAGAPLQVAYTPLHGVGLGLAQRAVQQAGFAPLHVVAAQAAPDGAFPTVRFPNPEEPGSMDAVLALAEAEGCALACANDPDADRLAVAARNAAGTLLPLTGDELGILLADHVLQGGTDKVRVATTRVSSRMLARLAAARGVAYDETLTGFKWLARRGLAAAANGERLAFAYEEALGYAVTNLVWDKDGISALVATLQLAAQLRAQGRTLWDQLATLQQAHGVHVTGQRTLAMDVAHGARLMQRLRQAPPAGVGDEVLICCDDLLPDHGSDVLLCYYAATGTAAAQARTHGLRLIVRPSGTEPKLKVYFERVAPANAPAAAERDGREATARWAQQRAQLGAKLAQDMDEVAQALHALANLAD